MRKVFKIKKKFKKRKLYLLLFIIIIFIFIYFNISEIKVNKSNIYLPINGNENIKVTLKGLGSKKIKWIIENEDIVTLENGVITGINNGETKIIAKAVNNKKAIVEVVVTDLISKPIINQNKDYLPCKRYNLEESNLLDKILKNRINEAGYKTRAGVLAAARFLTLEFPYKINYFNENGRLNNHSQRDYADGEGRYYHKGLYLHESKFKDIIASKNGPAIWGCKLYEKFYKKYSPNGLDCSGFISWALLNGGFDVGDSGAGDYKNRNDDLGDLGEKLKFNKNLFNRIKAGDLVWRDGHIGIIIGIDTKNIYIAESFDYSLRVRTFKKVQLINNEEFPYVLLMDEIYKKDGKYTNMW